MRQSCVRAVRRAAQITNEVCRGCDTTHEHRCCQPAFCLIVQAGLEAIGRPIEPVNDPLLYMGSEGCVVPPELRPACSGYACPNEAPPKVLQESQRLMAKALQDPTIRRLRLMAGDASAAILLRRKPSK